MSATIIVFGTIASVEELKHVGAQSKPVIKFSVVTPNGEAKKEGEQYAPSQFYKVELWDKQATTLAPHLVKGVKVQVMGNHVVREWETDTAKGVEQLIKYPKIELTEWQKTSENEDQETRTTTKKTHASTSTSDVDDSIPF